VSAVPSEVGVKQNSNCVPNVSLDTGLVFAHSLNSISCSSVNVKVRMVTFYMVVTTALEAAHSSL